MTHHRAPANPSGPPSLRSHLLVLAMLLALLLASAGTALLPLGVFNTLANVGIAVAKALLVLAFFMHLRRGDALLRIAAATGFAWLSLLFAFTLADYLTRSVLVAPW